MTPSGTSTFTISGTAAASAGNYTIDVQGTAAAETRNLPLTLGVFTQAAGGFALDSPADGATNVSQQPLLGWFGSSQADSYLVEVATDEQFSSIVYSASTPDETHVVAAPLPSNTQLFWRVTAGNACGGFTSPTFSFVTVALPGDCSLGSSTQVHFLDDLEVGDANWTTGGTGSTWVLQSGTVNSGVSAFHAVDPADVSDQWLISPPISLPAATTAHTLQFWNRQIIEDRSGGCYDGGMLDVSVDDGATWSQVPDSAMLTDPYDGPLSTGHSNPAGGLDAWCGDPQDWLNSVVDIAPWAGQTVRFRFRLASDSSVDREGWYIDDVLVQSCSTESIFVDGFES